MNEGFYRPWGVLFYGTAISAKTVEWTSTSKVQEVKEKLDLERYVSGYNVVYTFTPKGSLSNIAPLAVFFFDLSNFFLVITSSNQSSIGILSLLGWLLPVFVFSRPIHDIISRVLWETFDILWSIENSVLLQQESRKKF